MMKKFFVSTAAIALALSVVSCANKQSGSPNPAFGSSVASVSTSGAPQVAQPLNVSNYVKDPCQLLSAAQLQTISFTLTNKPTTDKSSALGAGCDWHDHHTGAHVGVAWQSNYTNGLNDLYAKKGEEKYFIPTQVEGYPAVYASESDDRPTGTCTLNVGPTNTSMFFVLTDAPPDQKTTACDIAQKAAGLAIDTMKNGGS